MKETKLQGFKVYPHLSKHEEELIRCIKCGLCRAVCPVFEVVGMESAVARGKVALIEAVVNGQLELTAIFADRIQRCLNCKTCIENCPSGVRVDDLILAARAELVESGKLPFIRRLIFRQLLRRGRLLPPVGKWTSFLQRMILKGLPQSSPYRLLLPLTGLDQNRTFPTFAPQALREQYPEVIQVSNRRMRVGYFTGCTANLIYTNVGQATIEVLRKNQIEVVIPRDQGCCGMPVFNAGDFITAQSMARENIAAFQRANVDAIVVSCSSCGLALRQEYKSLLEVGGFGVPVYEITEFLMGVIDLNDELHPVHLRVTYHDPCHLNRGLGIREQPRRLLQMIPELGFVEMEDADRCCGAGGLFSFSYFEISKQISERKLAAITKTESEVVVTGCPSCTMHLRDMMAREGLPQRVMHPVELMGLAYNERVTQGLKTLALKSSDL